MDLYGLFRVVIFKGDSNIGMGDTNYSCMSGTTSIDTGGIPKLRDSGMTGTTTPVWVA